METLAKEQEESASSQATFFLGDAGSLDLLSPASQSTCSSTSSVNDSDEDDDSYLSDSESSDVQNLRVSFKTADLSETPAPDKPKHPILINNESLEDLNLQCDPCRSVTDDPSSPDVDRVSYTDVVTLEVPVMKQRSTSLDASCMMGSPKKDRLGEGLKDSPGKKQARSKSMDSNMPRKGSSATSAILALLQQSFK